MENENQVRDKLKEMYRTLLLPDDKRFHELQRWLFELTESDQMEQYSQTLQKDMLGCLDQYREECRYVANDRHPGPDWPYQYFLP
jgi:hypothetical protein